VPHLDRRDATADDELGETHADGLDLGKLRHGANLPSACDTSALDLMAVTMTPKARVRMGS
jgi:hypothetical protein